MFNWNQEINYFPAEQKTLLYPETAICSSSKLEKCREQNRYVEKQRTKTENQGIAKVFFTIKVLTYQYCCLKRNSKGISLQ